MKTKFAVFDYSGNKYFEYLGKYPDDSHLFNFSDDGRYYIIGTESGMNDSEVKIYNSVIPIHTFFKNKSIPDFPFLINNEK